MSIISLNELLDLVSIPAGEFVMGSKNEFYREAPAHTVKFGSGFLLAKTPVTQAQWQMVMETNPSKFRDSPRLPVDGVSWDQSMEFCRRLSDLSGRRIRLPSEAEWEYACRAGTATEYYCGPWGPFKDDSDVPHVVEQALCQHAWFELNSSSRTHPAGQKLPNPWGLYDMIGNVWEWCADVWHSDYDAAPQDGSAWVESGAPQPRRCLRGGAWDMNAFRCRSSYRSFDHREMAADRFGLRVAVDR